MRLALSTRATIWPTRPKPAITTWPSPSGSASKARISTALGVSISSSSSSSGVAAIDSVTATDSSSASGGSSTVADTPAVNSTKANSPPWAIASAKRRDGPGSRPARRPSTYSTAILIASRPPTTASTSMGFWAIRPRLSDMPTAVKNSPSSRPSKGAMSALISCRYSESASSTPAMKAPSAADSPAYFITSVTPTTVSSALAVIASFTRVRATRR